MVTHLNYNTRNLKFVGKRKRPRRAWGSYRGTMTTEERALAAVALVESGWAARRASTLCCVCLTNVYFVQALSAADRALLADGKVSISRLRKRQIPLLRRMATAGRVAKAPAAQVPTFDAAGIGRLVDQLVARFGAGVWMDAVDRATAPGAPKPAANGNGVHT